MCYRCMGAGVIGTYIGVEAVVLRSWCVVLCTVCLSVSTQLAWFLGWGLGRVSGRKEQRVRVASALFRDKLSFFVEGVYQMICGVYVVLFVWHQEGGVSKWFYEGHCFIHRSVFMSVVEDM